METQNPSELNSTSSVFFRPRKTSISPFSSNHHPLQHPHSTSGASPPLSLHTQTP